MASHPRSRPFPVASLIYGIVVHWSRPAMGSPRVARSCSPPAAWPMVLVARATDRVGKGLRGPPRDAIIADETTLANRGRAFGFHRAADTAGAVVGPLLGLALYEAVGQQFRPLLWIAVVPAGDQRRPGVPHPRTAASGHIVRHRLVAMGVFLAGTGGCSTLAGTFALVNFPDTLLLLRADNLGYGFAGVVAL